MFVRMILILLCFWNFSHAEMFQSVPEANAMLIQSGKDKYSCPNCGMHLLLP